MAKYWSINGRFVTQPFSGVQRYAYEIVRALDGLISENHPLAEGIYLELVVPADTQVLPELNAISLRRVGKGHGHGWEQMSLARAVGGGLLSLCNSGPLAVGRQTDRRRSTRCQRRPRWLVLLKDESDFNSTAWRNV